MASDVNQVQFPERVNFFHKVESAFQTFQPLSDEDSKSFKLFLNRHNADLRFEKVARTPVPERNCWTRLFGVSLPEAEDTSFKNKIILNMCLAGVKGQKKSLLRADGSIDQEKVNKLKVWQQKYVPHAENELEEYQEEYGSHCCRDLSKKLFSSLLVPQIQWDEIAKQQHDESQKPQKEDAVQNTIANFAQIIPETDKYKDLLERLHTVTKHPALHRFRTCTKEDMAAFSSIESFLEQRILEARFVRLAEKLVRFLSFPTLSQSIGYNLIKPILNKLDTSHKQFSKKPVSGEGARLPKELSLEEREALQKELIEMKGLTKQITAVFFQAYDLGFLSYDLGDRLEKASLDGNVENVAQEIAKIRAEINA